MKTIILALAVLAGLCLSTETYAQQKHALIFAIGDYPEDGGWSKISSERDINYIKNTLTKQGFPAAGIQVVQDAQATRAGIDKAFKDLIGRVKAKDVIVIHFSSHGVQLADDNGDEADGFDESIVPYDAVLPSSDMDKAAYQKVQANYFRDDALGTYIEQIRAAAGKEGDVLVFMDACHSGTGTRGSAQAKHRGTSKAIAPAGYVASKNNADGKGSFQDGAASRGNSANLATYIVYSAAQANELNYETFNEENEGMGSLTYAISKSFENLKTGASYRSVFANIQSVMNDRVPGQSPVVEGTGLDRGLFAGNYVDQKPYVEIAAIPVANMLNVKAGKFAGLDVGAKIGVYPRGTTNPAGAKALAMGTVTKAGNTTATVKLDKDIELTLPADGWVFVTGPVYNVPPINIAFKAASRGAAAAFSDGDMQKIRSAVKAKPLFTFNPGKADLIIARGKGVDSIIIADDGQLFTTVANAATDTADFSAKVDQYAQYRFLKNLVVDDPSLNVEVVLVPFINGAPDETAIESKKVDGKYNLYDGDEMVLMIRNKGAEDVYVNILDIQPNGIINPVLPNRDQRMYPSDLKIPAGSTRVFKDYVLGIAEPYGTEVYKIFVSKTELNVEGLATPKSASRGNLSVLESLVKTSGSLGTRGTPSNNLAGANGKTFNLVFNILPRK